MSYRTTVELDENLLSQAKTYAQTTRTKDAIAVALSYYVSHVSETPKPKKNIFDLKGKIRFADGYDYKSLRQDRTFEGFENLTNLESVGKKMQNKFLVDTSVLNNKQTKQVEFFENTVNRGLNWAISIYTYREVLQGSLDEQEILFLPNNSEVHAVGAKYYHSLRQHGITVLNTIDMVIAQTAIEYNLKLLHNDRDFDNIAKYVTDLQMFTGSCLSEQ